MYLLGYWRITPGTSGKLEYFPGSIVSISESCGGGGKGRKEAHTLSLSTHQAKNHTKPHYFRSGGLIHCHVDVSEHFWDTYTLLLIRNRDQRAWGSRPVLSSVFVYIEPERGRAAGPPHNILNNISQVCGPHLMPACSNWKRLGM